MNEYNGLTIDDIYLDDISPYSKSCSDIDDSEIAIMLYCSWVELKGEIARIAKCPDWK